MKLLLIDFDGTLCDPHNVPPGYRMGMPVPGAAEYVRKLKLEGHSIIIFTLRAATTPGRLAVIKWLQWARIPYDDVTNVKRDGIIVDNNALRFEGDWKQTYATIQQLEPSPKIH